MKIIDRLPVPRNRGAGNAGVIELLVRDLAARRQSAKTLIAALADQAEP